MRYRFLLIWIPLLAAPLGGQEPDSVLAERVRRLAVLEGLGPPDTPPDVGAEIDRVTTSTRSLSEDLTVAPHERNRFRRIDRELDLAAMARTFQTHGYLLECSVATWRSASFATAIARRST